MDSDAYKQILEIGLLPFISSTFPDHHRFQQDNDPKHTSRSTQAFLTDSHINSWKTPAESPDLNPIENVWGSMKTYLREAFKPRDLDSLKIGIKQFWNLKVTSEACRRYIGHLNKVIPNVIEQNGGPSGF